MAYVQPITQPASLADHVETEAERQSRFAREAEGIAAARASIAAGRYADADDIDA
jgi:hypothetical protein